jgi:uncharacterized protein YciI
VFAFSKGYRGFTDTRNRGHCPGNIFLKSEFQNPEIGSGSPPEKTKTKISVFFFIYFLFHSIIISGFPGFCRSGSIFVLEMFFFICLPVLCIMHDETIASPYSFSGLKMSSSPIYLYLIHCLDDQSCGMVDRGSRFGGSVKRLSVYTEHKAYQGQTANPDSPNFIKKIAAGPMESDDGKFMIGSCFIVESTREAADKFINEDPFHAAGVWEKV